MPIIRAAIEEDEGAHGLREDDVMALGAHEMYAQECLLHLIDHLKGNLQACCVVFVGLHLTQLLAEVLGNSAVCYLVLRADFARVSDFGCYRMFALPIAAGAWRDALARDSGKSELGPTSDRIVSLAGRCAYGARCRFRTYGLPATKPRASAAENWPIRQLSREASRLSLYDLA